MWFNITPVHTLQTKRDNYTLSKISSENYRVIQCTDVVVEGLMKRYYGAFAQRVYNNYDRYVIVFDPLADWHPRWSGMAKWKHAMGIDFSGFDRHQCPHIIGVIFRLIGELSGAPPEFTECVINWLTNAPILIPGKGMYDNLVGNPSGQYLTTLLNSMYHELANLAVYSRYYGVHPSKLGELVEWWITSDDGVDFHNTPIDCVWVQDLFRELFGLDSKIEGPFEAPRRPSYLGQRSVVYEGRIYPIPADAARTLTTYYIELQNNGNIVEVAAGTWGAVLGAMYLVTQGVPLDPLLVRFYHEITRKLEGEWKARAGLFQDVNRARVTSRVISEVALADIST
jgi:hypothetical protein